MTYLLNVFRDTDGEGEDRLKEVKATKWLNENAKDGFRLVSMSTTPTGINAVNDSYSVVESSITVVVTKGE